MNDEMSVALLNDSYSLDFRLPVINPGLDDVSFDGLQTNSFADHHFRSDLIWDIQDEDVSPTSAGNETSWFESTFKVIAQSDSDLGVAVNPNVVLPKTSPQDDNRPLMIKDERRNREGPQESELDLSNNSHYDRPGFSYVCLIGLALKNSKTGSLPVSVIYKFLSEQFPYFRSAPHGWKNSIRHNLSLNKCFEKVEKPSVGGSCVRKTHYWAVHPSKKYKVEQEILKCFRKDPAAARKCMAFPENLGLMEKGDLKSDYPTEEVEETSPAIDMPTGSAIFTFEPASVRVDKIPWSLTLLLLYKWAAGFVLLKSSKKKY